MIAKRINPGKHRYNIGKLVSYVVDANHKGEKCLLSWQVGCENNDFDLALLEMQATQTMNTRCKTDKTCHIIVSFRPEDEQKLTEAVYKQVEEAIAQSLGLSEHQRICGVHKNTNNIHLHIAYNLINPVTYRKESLWQDHYKMSAACRSMEKQFGLTIDNGAEHGTPKRQTISQRAAAMEAHSGEQSFQSYVLGLREQIQQRMATAQNWQDTHLILADYGIALRRKGKGLVLADREGDGAIKAGALGMSKGKLERRFGPYQAPVRRDDRRPAEGPAPVPAANFQDSVLSRKASIMEQMRAADTWQDVHRILANHGLELRPKANGVVLADRNSEATMKASVLDRRMSKAQLEKRFGAFVPPDPAQTQPAEVPLPEFETAPPWPEEPPISALDAVPPWPEEPPMPALDAAPPWPEEPPMPVFDAGPSWMDEPTPPEFQSASFGDNEPPPWMSDGPLSPVEELDEWPSVPRRTYRKQPKQVRSPERDQLYKEYQEALAEKIAKVDAEKARNSAAWNDLQTQWREMKASIYADSPSRSAAASQLRILRELHQPDVDEEKVAHKAIMAGIKADYPWYNWNTYLQHQATQGNTVALDVLRAQEERKAAQAAIKHPAPKRINLVVPYEEKDVAKAAGARWDAKDKRWYVPKGADLDRVTAWLSDADRPPPGEQVERAERTKREEQGVAETPKPPKESVAPGVRLARLKEIEALRMKLGSAGASRFDGAACHVDNRGVVIVVLASGGTIRDTGGKLYYSSEAQQAARLYAQAKFGKSVRERGNTIEYRESIAGRVKKLFKPHIGIIRARESARNSMHTLSQLNVVRRWKQAKVFLQGHVHSDLER